MRPRIIPRHLTALVKAAPLLLFWAVATRLSVQRASALGAWLFGAVGPLAGKQRHVIANLSIVMPEAGDRELRLAARQVWRTLGAVFAEYPHLHAIVRDRVETSIALPVQCLLRERRPLLFVAGHVGNWEILAPVLGSLGIELLLVHARNSNPYIEARLQRFRRTAGCEFVVKDNAVRELFNRARDGRSIGLLPDQRVDSGVMLPFFDRDAITTISPARIARRLGYPIVPISVERLPGARFKVCLHEPLPVPDTGSDKDAAIQTTRQFHQFLEARIRREPGAWLCTKRRWPKMRNVSA